MEKREMGKRDFAQPDTRLPASVRLYLSFRQYGARSAVLDGATPQP
jgi:hypothetical protein